ncbi:sugar ABC transporter substrate-binding protein [Microbacterium sp. OR21]|uniref:sugar ABC transporter substrate-binding protein n=1 Tax=Microbacterium sp. OR21 TaxID=3095346 RepID=UPI0039B5F398
MKNTRLIGVALLSALSLGTLLTGCSASAGDTGSADADKGAIAVSFPGLDIQIWVDMLDYMKPKIEDAGYEMLSDDPQWNIQNQVQSWESWVQRGDLKALFGNPVQVDSVQAVTDQATAAGIPVLGYSTEWDGTEASLLIDNYKDGLTLGEEAGKWIVDKYGDEKVPVFLFSYYENDLGIDRSNGVKDGLKKAGANVEIAESSALTIQDGMDGANSQLAANPDTKVWLSVGSDSMIGAYRALLDSGVAPDDDSYLLGALDATNESLGIIKEKDSIWRLGYILPAKMLSDHILDLVFGAAEGEKLETITVESIRVTPENADDYIVQ